ATSCCCAAMRRAWSAMISSCWRMIRNRSSRVAWYRSRIPHDTPGVPHWQFQPPNSEQLLLSARIEVWAILPYSVGAHEQNLLFSGKVRFMIDVAQAISDTVRELGGSPEDYSYINEQF